MEILTYPQRPRSSIFLLDVPFNSQLDNSPNKGQGSGNRQCNLTCAAMLAKYCKPELWNEYTDFANGFQDLLDPYGDTTDHNAITHALEAIGIESYFSYSASIDDAVHSLYCGLPFLIGTDYKAGGHMVLLHGRKENGLICHNPYGYRRGTSYSWTSVGGRSGENEFLSWSWLKDCFVDMGAESGWARFVTEVNNVPTGVKFGL